MSMVEASGAGSGEAAPKRGPAGWCRRHASKLRHACRVTVAALLAYALAEWLGLAQGYWAVLTAVIVMQASVGASLNATIDRLIGTIAGAGFSVVVALVVPHDKPATLALALAIAIAPLAAAAAFRPAFRIAPVTAVIVLVGGAGHQVDPLAYALGRVAEIGLGSVIGLGVALVVLPARAHGLMRDAARAMLALLALQVELGLGCWAGPSGAEHGNDRAAARALQARIRAAQIRVDDAAGEARRERVTHLSDAPDPAPVPRTLRRINHDLVMIARATAEAPPEPFRAALDPPIAPLTAALAGYLRAAGAALAERAPPPGLAAVSAAFDAWDTALAAVRREGVSRGLPVEAVGRVFALAFALEQLRSDIDDLAARVGEFAGRRPLVEQPA